MKSQTLTATLGLVLFVAGCAQPAGPTTTAPTVSGSAPAQSSGPMRSTPTTQPSTTTSSTTGPASAGSFEAAVLGYAYIPERSLSYTVEV